MQDKKLEKKTSQKSVHDGPYGCPLAPDAKEFPRPKMKNLPQEPLKKGEQYFRDLAGNILKGPVAKVTCNCSPLFHKVEEKMDQDKKELKEHIDSCRENLNEKICDLEKKTSHQLVSLNETFKSRLNTERVQCIERTQRCNLKQRMDFERSQLQQGKLSLTLQTG